MTSSWHLKLVLSAISLMTLSSADELENRISFGGTSILVNTVCTDDKIIEIKKVSLEKTKSSGSFDASNPGASCVENTANAKTVLDQLTADCAGQVSCAVTVQNIPALDTVSCPTNTYLGVRFVRVKYICKDEKIVCGAQSYSLACSIRDLKVIHIESVIIEQAATEAQGCPPKPGSVCTAQKDTDNALFRVAYDNCEGKSRCNLQLTLQPADPNACPSTTYKGPRYIRIKYSCREFGTYPYMQCLSTTAANTPPMTFQCPAKGIMFIEQVTVEKAKLTTTGCPTSTDNCVLQDKNNDLYRYISQFNCHGSPNPCTISNVDPTAKMLIQADTDCKSKGYAGYSFIRVIYTCKSPDFNWISKCVDPKAISNPAAAPAFELTPLCLNNKMMCIRQMTVGRTINRNALPNNFCSDNFYSIDPYRNDCLFNKQDDRIVSSAKDQCNTRQFCNVSSAANLALITPYPTESTCNAATYTDGYVYNVLTFECLERGVYNLQKCCGDCKPLLVNKPTPDGKTPVSGSGSRGEDAVSYEFLAIIIGGLLGVPVLLGIVVLITVIIIKRKRSNDDSDDEDD